MSALAFRTIKQEIPGGSAELGIMTHEGRDFSALGAVVTETHIACYPHDDGTVRGWNGDRLGTYRVVSSRPAVFFGYRSWQGERVVKRALGNRPYDGVAPSSAELRKECAS